MRHASLFVLQFFQGLVDAFLAECVDGQAFNEFVFAARAGHREAGIHYGLNSIPVNWVSTIVKGNEIDAVCEVFAKSF